MVQLKKTQALTIDSPWPVRGKRKGPNEIIYIQCPNLRARNPADKNRLSSINVAGHKAFKVVFGQLRGVAPVVIGIDGLKTPKRLRRREWCSGAEWNRQHQASKSSKSCHQYPLSSAAIPALTRAAATSSRSATWRSMVGFLLYS